MFKLFFILFSTATISPLCACVHFWLLTKIANYCNVIISEEKEEKTIIKKTINVFSKENESLIVWKPKICECTSQTQSSTFTHFYIGITLLYFISLLVLVVKQSEQQQQHLIKWNLVAVEAVVCSRMTKWEREKEKEQWRSWWWWWWWVLQCCSGKWSI